MTHNSHSLPLLTMLMQPANYFLNVKNELKRVDVFLCYFSCNKFFLTPNPIQKRKRGGQNMKYAVNKEHFYLSQSHCNIASAGDGAFVPVASASSPTRAGDQ